jgi:hypothetical protein
MNFTCEDYICVIDTKNRAFFHVLFGMSKVIKIYVEIKLDP